MNDSVFGIVVTFLVLGIVLTAALITNDDFSIPQTGIERIPAITSSTDITPNAYYEWCYKMNFDCS